MKEIPGLNYLSWDSDFFGKKIGRIAIPSDRKLAAIWNEAKEAGYRCLFLESNFGDRETLQFCLDRGGRLTDIKTVLGVGIEPPESSAALPGVTAEAGEEVKSRAESIAAEVLAPLSRYAVDPGFGLEESRRLYRRWADQALRGDFSRAVFYFLSKKNEAAGFITLREKEDGLFIDLFAVAPDFRGRNIGSRLIGAAKKWSAEQSFTRLRVTTQGYNVKAVRAYEKNGFRTERVRLFFHLWL